MRINLAVPFSERAQARRLGARWDIARRCWYIVDLEDISPFLRWIPYKHLTQPHQPKVSA